MTRFTKGLNLVPEGVRAADDCVMRIRYSIDFLEVIAGTAAARVIVARIAKQYGLDVVVPEVPEPPLGILHNPTT